MQLTLSGAATILFGNDKFFIYTDLNDDKIFAPVSLKFGFFLYLGILLKLTPYAGKFRIWLPQISKNFGEILLAWEPNLIFSNFEEFRWSYTPGGVSVEFRFSAKNYGPYARELGKQVYDIITLCSTRCTRSSWVNNYFTN